MRPEGKSEKFLNKNKNIYMWPVSPIREKRHILSKVGGST